MSIWLVLVAVMVVAALVAAAGGFRPRATRAGVPVRRRPVRRVVEQPVERVVERRTEY